MVSEWHLYSLKMGHLRGANDPMNVHGILHLVRQQTWSYMPNINPPACKDMFHDGNFTSRFDLVEIVDSTNVLAHIHP